MFGRCRNACCALPVVDEVLSDRQVGVLVWGWNVGNVVLDYFLDL